MRNSQTEMLYRYWNLIRGQRLAPNRHDIEPSRIRSVLANTFILELDENKEFSFRLAGSHVCGTYCRELKGRSFAHLFNDQDQEALKSLIKAVTQDCAVALFTFEGITSSHHDKETFEVALMPLKHLGAYNQRILGCFSAQSKPYWMGMRPIVEQSVTSLRIIWPDSIHEGTTHIGDLSFVPRVEFDKLRTMIPMPNSKVQPLRVAKGRRLAHLSVIDGGKH